MFSGLKYLVQSLKYHQVGEHALGKDIGKITVRPALIWFRVRSTSAVS